MSCRTAAQGGHVQRCEAGHIVGVWFNSCWHRYCPRCKALKNERWLNQQREKLLACAHRHVLFTLPGELRVLFRLNEALFTDALFDAVRDTMLTLPSSLSAAALNNELSRLSQLDWNVRVGERYGHGVGVATYLARYLNGGALRDSQLRRVGDEDIAFSYTGHRANSDGPRRQTLRLTPAQFIARYLAHVPQQRRRMLRCAGLYAGGAPVCQDTP